jgi:hypothetical protein
VNCFVALRILARSKPITQAAVAAAGAFGKTFSGLIFDIWFVKPDG